MASAAAAADEEHLLARRSGAEGAARSWRGLASTAAALALLASALVLVAGRAGRAAIAGRAADGFAAEFLGLASDAGDVTAPYAADEAPCGMALQGSACYSAVVWAMTDGISKHPEWYPGLSETSLYEDFQRHLSTDKKNNQKNKCPRPCEKLGCKTTKPGTACWDNVQWIMTKGLADHPEWFKGLHASSPVEDFQDHVHATNATACPTTACNPQPFAQVSLFCWMVVRKQGYELPLVQAQAAKKAGIFACDDFALVSDSELGVKGAKTLLIASTVASGYTRDGTSPNAPIFVAAWDQIRRDGSYRQHPWTVKNDPDAVLIPARLKMKLVPGSLPKNPYPPPWKASPSAGLWVTNCDKMASWGAGWGDGWPMMYGAVEIISREAIDNYFRNIDMCKATLPWQGMGEDAFMGMCLRKLKVGELFLKQGDGSCAGGMCTDPNYQAFHPRKDIGSWMECWGQANR